MLLGRWAVGPLGRWAVGPLGRWAVGPLGRWAIGPLAIGVCVLGNTPRSAQAGEWIASYKWVSGKSTGTFGSRVYASNGPLVSETFAYDYPTQAFTDTADDYLKTYPNLDNSAPFFRGLHAAGVGSVSTTAIQIAGRAQAKGQVQIIWEWRPRPGETKAGPVPEYLSYVIRASAQGFACNEVSRSPLDTENRNRQGEKATASIGLDNSTSREDLDSRSGTRQIASATALVREKTNNRRRIVGKSFSIGASGSVPDNRRTLRPSTERPEGMSAEEWKFDRIRAFVGQTSANISVSAELDYRSVTLSRANAHDEWPDNKGHMHGDSIYSATSESTSIGNSYGLLRYEALLQGDWPKDQNGYKDVTRDWDAQGFDRILAEHPISVEGFTAFGNPVLKRAGWRDSFSTYYDGSPTGKQEYTTTYTVTDNVDGAVAEAKYFLTLHDPVEEAVAPTLTSYDLTRLVTLPGGQKFFGGPHTQNDDDAYNATDETVYGYGADASIGIEGYRGLLGLSIQGSAEVSSTADVTLKVPVPTLTATQECYLMAIYPFQRKHVKFWKYDSGGEIKRFITDSSGVKAQVYHEAFEDTPGLAKPQFTIVDKGEMDYRDVPEKDAPAPEYDYPSGGAA